MARHIDKKELFRKELEYAHLGIDIPSVDFNKLRNPLEKYRSSEQFMEILRAMRDPNNFYFTLKYIFNIEPTIFQIVLLQELWVRPFPLLIASRGASKSFLFALYALLRAVITQGSKILIVSASFRQSKNVFDYAENIVKNAPILRDLIGDMRIVHDNDMWLMQVGDSIIRAIPLGASGEKIRGLRANYILVDEFQCLSGDGLVETDIGLIRLEDCKKYENILINNKDGEYEKPDHFIITPKQKGYTVKLQRGFSFTCSRLHKVFTTEGEKSILDLRPGDKLISENKYKFPENYFQIEDGIKLDEKMARAIGQYIGGQHEHSYFSSSIKEKLDIKYDKIPSGILMSPRWVMIHFLAGLFLEGGRVFCGKDLLVIFSTEYKQLANEVLIVLLKLGFNSHLYKRSNRYYVKICGIEAYHFSFLLNINEWKSSLSKFNCQYEKIPRVINTHTVLKVISIEESSEEEHFYDFHLPKTHSFYANGIVQHNSVPEEIYEVVIGGFGAVSSSPSDNVKKMAKVRMLKDKGMWTEEHEKILQTGSKPNQTILAGTGDWGFKHFAKYWKKWRGIVLSRGDIDKLREATGGEIENGFDWKDYSVIRLPIDLIPEGFMDEKSIAKAKASIHTSRYICEYGGCFASDSDGFFKRSLVESCVTKEPIYLPSGEIQFRARVVGDYRGKYIYGIDPASESDNFAIVILEQHEDHNRVVYCWTTTRQRMIKKRKAGLVAKDENDFYQYIAKKIRKLMDVFPCKHIALDSQGGGYGVMEALHNMKALKNGELPIWPIMKEHPLFWPGGKDYGYDDEAGLHLIEMVSFGKADYVLEANHGMKMDMQSKILLFPLFDPIEISVAANEDAEEERLHDTLEDVVLEIEELKEELATIIHTTTQNGRDKWDTPEVILPGMKKGKLRKDRYSALLMANCAARRMNTTSTIYHQSIPAGGMASAIYAQENRDAPLGKMYTGPAWFTENVGNWGQVVQR